MSHKLTIGYVGIADLPDLREEDIKCLDVINLAFGHVKENSVVWDHKNNLDYIKKAKEINPDLKVVLSIGGWSAGGFSNAATTKEGREQFAKTASEIVKEGNLDGIDIDWEYPCISIAGIDASPNDKETFTLLLKEIREELDRSFDRHLILSIAAGGDSYFTRCTNMKEAHTYLDYVMLMTYDLRGGFVLHSGHHTNLYMNQADLSVVSADTCVKEYVKAGVPIEKLIMGVAFYSRKWEGVPDVNHGLMQMAETPGYFGPDYGELSKNYIDKNGYTRYWDDEAKAPYLFNGKTFISYDDEESIRCKADYVKKEGMLGIMYWEYKCDSTMTLTKVIADSLKE